jgi:Plavaka transposase
MQPWTQTTVRVEGAGVTAVMHHRNLLEMCAYMFANLGPDHALVANKLVVDGVQVYFRLHNCNWWLKAQSQIPPHAIIIPIIFYSDKTQCDDLRTITER